MFNSCMLFKLSLLLRYCHLWKLNTMQKNQKTTQQKAILTNAYECHNICKRSRDHIECSTCQQFMPLHAWCVHSTLQGKV